MDISIIMDEDNVVAPHKGLQIEVPPLCENLEDTVEIEKSVARQAEN